jgi:hypothetical protein
MALQEELFQIERSLWTNDPELYEAIYAPDAILIFPEVGKIEQALRSMRSGKRTGKEGVGRMYTSRK